MLNIECEAVFCVVILMAAYGVSCGHLAPNFGLLVNEPREHQRKCSTHKLNTIASRQFVTTTNSKITNNK
jgi:hypothetical protein